MNEVLLIKLGEIVLKGLNKNRFEEILLRNIRRRLDGLGQFDIRTAQSTVCITPKGVAGKDGAAADESVMDEAVKRISKVFGIVTFSRAYEIKKEINEILEASAEFLKEDLLAAHTFKVEARRSDKRFPLKSPEICARAGEYLLSKYPNLRVDVNHPDYTVYVEVRDTSAFVHGNPLRGAGGIPVGTGGRAAVLISGGIDSPVAAWMMARRGVELTAVHFASPPYTSERAEQKVRDLLTALSGYTGRVTMYTVPFAKVQEEIMAKCPEELFTILMRRFMMRAAERIAKEESCSALITGESLGQVASQTMEGIVCTDAVAEMPVFRPLIGMDKTDIIAIARKIGTYDISIEPYEDCCTVFTPRHPRTKPELERVFKAEQALDCAALVEDCVGSVKKIRIVPEDSGRELN